MAKKVEKKVSETSNGNDLFTFVNKDSNVSIHDEQLKTKATTFAKDAFKRFCKNKSSIVGAVIILLLLLMSVFVPLLSPYNINKVDLNQQELHPKLFPAGTGWWDGCISYTNQYIDPETDLPAGFNPNAVIDESIRVEDVSYIDTPYKYARGGYFVITNNAPLQPGELPEDNTWFVKNYSPFKLLPFSKIQMTLKMYDENNIFDYQLAKYRVVLYDSVELKNYPISDWMDADTTERTYDLSTLLSDKYSISMLEKAQIKIEGIPSSEVTTNSYFAIEELTLTATGDDRSQDELLEDISIVDCNEKALQQKQTDGRFPRGYWQSNGFRRVYHAAVVKVSFTFDEYKDRFGDRDMVVGLSILNEYISKGWCEMSNLKDISTFRILNEEKCPIKAIYTVNSIVEPDGREVVNYDTTTTYYKYLGYSSMPKFIFGTNASGRDMFTLAFSSLKTSLLVAIISSAICFIIGLVWGSISGYFGGTVDLVMERITDILSGIPWIVMMTLIILLLGNSIVTFAIALVMTGWIGTSATTRTQFYRFRDREYVLASRTLGASDGRLIFKHILPNGLGTIVTSSVLMIPSCIFSEASISYLGLGLQGVNSFGVILSENQVYISSNPVLILMPAVIISLLMISFNLFGNGLRDALNPTLKGGEQ